MKNNLSTTNTRTWLKSYQPEYLELALKNAPLDYGYLLILEYANNEIRFATSRYPAKYVNTLMAHERQNGIKSAIRVHVSELVFRGESLKRALQKKLMEFYDANKGRYLIQESILHSAVDEIFSIAKNYKDLTGNA